MLQNYSIQLQEQSKLHHGTIKKLQKTALDMIAGLTTGTGIRTRNHSAE